MLKLLGDKFLDVHGCQYVIDNLRQQRYQKSPNHIDTSLMLLSNALRTQRGVMSVLGIENTSCEEPNIITEAFLQSLFHSYLSDIQQ